MENENIRISSTALELSETTNYIELTNRLCYYGEPNLNGVVLPADTAEKFAQTLVLQPVVAKYKLIGGKPDLGGHEYHNGTFGTENIGVHESVEVREDTVPVNGESKTLPCLFAKARIWTRNKNMIAAVKRLFNEGRLHSSWEIAVREREQKGGVEILKDYMFTSNALLGTNSQPAYGDTASALSMAEQEPEYIIASALAKDLGMEDENSMSDVKNNQGETKPEASASDSAMAEKLEGLTAEIGKLSASMSEKDAALVSANEKLTAAEAKVAELEEFRTKYEALMAEQKKAEDEAVRASMRESAKKSGLFAENELETSEELRTIMEKADKDALNGIIAERFMKSLEKKETPEMSEAKPDVPKADVSEDTRTDNKKFMSMLLHN